MGSGAVGSGAGGSGAVGSGAVLPCPLSTVTTVPPTCGRFRISSRYPRAATVPSTAHIPQSHPAPKWSMTTPDSSGATRAAAAQESVYMPWYRPRPWAGESWTTRPFCTGALTISATVHTQIVSAYTATDPANAVSPNP